MVTKKRNNFCKTFAYELRFLEEPKLAVQKLQCVSVIKAMRNDGCIIHIEIIDKQMIRLPSERA